MEKIIVWLCVICLFASYCAPAYALESGNVVTTFECPIEANENNTDPSLEILGSEDEQAFERAYAATEKREETIKYAFILVCIILVVSTVIQFFNQ